MRVVTSRTLSEEEIKLYQCVMYSKLDDIKGSYKNYSWFQLITMLSNVKVRFRAKDDHKTEGRLYSAASGSPPNPAASAALRASGFSKLFLFLSRLHALESPPSSSMALADLHMRQT